MQKIALLTDSACDLPLEILSNENIKLLPLIISYSTGDYKDKIDISSDKIYKNFENEIPKTSLPLASNTEDTICELESQGYTHAIVVTISSGLSGCCNSLRLAFLNHPNLKSIVYDSKILAMPQGIMVLEISKLIKRGLSFDEIVASLPNIRSKISGYFTLSTLEYLKTGGRIGRVAGTIGEILSLKPIITVDENGIYYTVAKPRGRKQSLLKLTNILTDELALGNCNVWVLHGGVLDEAKKFLESLKPLNNILSLSISEISPALGVHAGPGLIGLAIQRMY